MWDVPLLIFPFFFSILFFQVDNSNSTLISVGTEITALFGTTFGFHDFFTTTMAKVKFIFYDFII